MRQTPNCFLSQGFASTQAKADESYPASVKALCLLPTYKVNSFQNTQRKQQHASLQVEEEVREKQAQEEAERQMAADKAQADATRRQKDAAHNDAVAAFQTLLAETVKDPTARWQVANISICLLDCI